MDVLFVAGFATITKDPGASRAFYEGALGLHLEGDTYRSTFALGGTKHFGIWPLSEAATACFGVPDWPVDIPSPQATIEFEVMDVPAAAAELVDRGYQLIHAARKEPWGQTVARLASPEGLLIGLSFAPWFHEDD